MSKKNYEENFPEEDIVVEMTDDEGNVFYYSEEMIIPVGDENFALLVAIPDEEEEHFHDEDCDCGCCDDEVIIAKIITDENGEEIYVEPTDEEFERVSKAYDELMGEE